jgi:benzoylformate decarboxylase
VAQLTGKHALLEQLVADGTRYVFGNPGTTEQSFMDALQDHPGLEFILGLHEGAVVGIADAYARATDRPAFVQVHIAPGLGNAVGMLFNAHASHSPLVVYAGQSASSALFQEPLLSGDLVAIARPVTKWAFELHHAADVPQALRRAMKVAEEAPRGPVLLSVPFDVMDEVAEVAIRPSTYTRWRVAPDPTAIDEAVGLLVGSIRPVLVVGDGVALAGAQGEVAQLAERLGAPIYNGYASEVNVANDHPLLSGTLPRTSLRSAAAAEDLVRDHDVVLAIGTPIFRFAFPAAGGLDPGSTTIIHVDVDGWEIGKNVPTALGIRSDARLALRALLDGLGTTPPAAAAERGRAIAERTAERRAALLAEDRAGWDGVPISPARLMSELAAALPQDTAVFEEAISASAVMARYLTPRPGSYYRARGGGIGPGLPGAIGLKLALPDRPVVGVTSDGSALYNITALWTAAHHGIPVVWVVCNNGTYQILKTNLAEYLGPLAEARGFLEMDLAEPALRFDRIAESFGVAGHRVERPGQIRPALEAALASGKPALVDVAIRSRPG